MAVSQEQLLDYLRNQIEWAFCSETKRGVLCNNDVVSGVFQSMCLLPPWGFSQKPIVEAVNKLEEHKKILIRFVVGLHVTHEEGMVLYLFFWSMFYHDHLMYHRINLAGIPKAQRLLEFTLINYKLSIAKRPLLVRKEIMKQLEISPSSFSRDWRPRLDVMENIIAKVEHSALFEVLAAIDGNKRKSHA